MIKILIVEDEVTLGKMYKKKFEALGYEVKLTRNVDETRKVTGEFHADLVFVDQGLGKKEESGLDLIPELRRKFPTTKVVMLSNYSQFQTRKEAIKAGADDYLVKLNTPPSILGEYVKRLFS